MRPRTRRWLTGMGITGGAAALLLALLLPAGCGSEPFARAVQITSAAQLIGGPAELGKVGDFLLYNDQIRVVIRNQGTSPGFGLYGGCVLDVDLNRGPEEFGGRGNDRFGELFPMVNFVSPRPDPDPEDGQPDVTVLADGSDGSDAIIRVEGDRGLYLYLLKLLPDVLNEEQKSFRIYTDYVLHPGARYLEIRTEVAIPDELEQELSGDLEIQWHDLPDATEPIDAFALLTNGQLPPILAEGEDLRVDEVDPAVVVSDGSDFEAAGVVAGHAIKVDDGAGGLTRASIIDVDGHSLTLDGAIDVAPGGAYFRVLGDPGEPAEVYGDFLFMGGKLRFFLPDDHNPARAHWNGGMGPGIGYDLDGTMLQVTEEGGSTFTDPFLVDFYAGTAEGVSYAYGTRDGLLSVPILTESFSVLFTHSSEYSSYLLPGHGVRFTRYLTVGEGDVASAAGVLWEQVRGLEVGRLEGHVLDGRRGDGVSDARVLVFRDPDPSADEIPALDDLAGPVLELGVDLARDRDLDGSFGGPALPGDYLVMAAGPGHTHSNLVRVSVEEGRTAEATLVLPETGTVTYDVVDARNEHIPCKLTFVSLDGAGRPDAMLGETYLPGDLAWVEFTATGTGSVELEAGSYAVRISRGPEYSLDERTVVVPAGGAAHLQGHIERVVDTTGWVSGDFHQHMMNSPDSGLSLEDRVISNMAEGVEYVVATDHDYLTNLRPTIEALGATEFIKSSVGDELTTVEQGHFNGWPLTFDTAAPEDGVVDWQAPSPSASAMFEDNDTVYPELNVFTPSDIFDGLRAAGAYGANATVIQANHVRDGILGYFYQYGIDVQTGEPSNDVNFLELFHPRINGDFFAWNFDTIEMSNGKRQDLIRTPTTEETAEFLEGRGTIYSYLARTAEEQEDLRTGRIGLDKGYSGGLDDWFNWLNKGLIYVATGNSDSHSKTKTEAGVVRNYIRSSTDRPDFIDEVELADNIRAGKVIHTYGPFIDFTVSGGSYGPGDIGGQVVDVDVDGTIDLDIRVQSPTWFDVDRIEIYQNGVMICEITSDSTCGDPAENHGLFHPNQDVVNFEGIVTVDLAEWWFHAAPDDQIPVTPMPMDSWFVVAALGDSTMAPVASEVTRPPVRVADVLSAAMAALRFEDMSSPLLSGIDIDMGASFHSVFPIVPWGITNPVFVEADGDGTWTAPGLPPYQTTFSWETD